MTLRDKVRRVFHRHSNSNGFSPKPKNNGIKIEYYKRHEIPRSKFKGPFDPEHQKKLAAWSFEGAMAQRSRSLDVPLSPCATLGDSVCPLDGNGMVEGPPEQSNGEEDSAEVNVDVDPRDASVTAPHDDYARQADSGSQSSTAVDPDSFNGSLSTLLPESHDLRGDSIAMIKESIRYTSPMVRAKSPPPKSPKGHMPFAPEDLSRALHAVQICA